MSVKIALLFQSGSSRMIDRLDSLAPRSQPVDTASAGPKLELYTPRPALAGSETGSRHQRDAGEHESRDLVLVGQAMTEMEHRAARIAEEAEATETPR